MDLRNQHVSWKVCLVAGAVMLALGGCDSKKSPDTAPVAPASQPVTNDPSGDSIGPNTGSASSAPPPPAATIGTGRPELRKPYTPKPDEPSLATLEPLLGKYPQDGTDFLRKGVLADRLKRLMGDRYDALMKSLGTVGPLTKEGAVWSINGNLPHEGGTASAAVVIDPVRNGVRVWMYRRGAETAYTDVAGDPIPWPPNVQTAIDNTK